MNSIHPAAAIVSQQAGPTWSDLGKQLDQLHDTAMSIDPYDGEEMRDLLLETIDGLRELRLMIVEQAKGKGAAGKAAAEEGHTRTEG